MNRVEAALLAGEVTEAALTARHAGLAGVAVRADLEVLDCETLLHVATSALAEMAHVYLDPADRPRLVRRIQGRRLALIVHGDRL